MSTYIEKPVAIEAAKFGERDFIEWTPWMQKAYTTKQFSYRFDPNTGTPNGFIVHSSEGDVTGGPGDYIIKDQNEELRAMECDIFESTFEKIKF